MTNVSKANNRYQPTGNPAAQTSNTEPLPANTTLRYNSMSRTSGRKANGESQCWMEVPLSSVLNTVRFVAKN